jgi:hypothetical protein
MSLFIDLFMKSMLQNLILGEVKVARPLVLFKVMRHDREIKRALGVKKLTKRMFYDLVDSRFLIRGKGDLVVTDIETAELLLSRIKERLRHDIQ